MRDEGTFASPLCPQSAHWCGYWWCWWASVLVVLLRAAAVAAVAVCGAGAVGAGAGAALLLLVLLQAHLSLLALLLPVTIVPGDGNTDDRWRTSCTQPSIGCRASSQAATRRRSRWHSRRCAHAHVSASSESRVLSHRLCACQFTSRTHVHAHLQTIKQKIDEISAQLRAQDEAGRAHVHPHVHAQVYPHVCNHVHTHVENTNRSGVYTHVHTQDAARMQSLMNQIDVPINFDAEGNPQGPGNKPGVRYQACFFLKKIRHS